MDSRDPAEGQAPPPHPTPATGLPRVAIIAASVASAVLLLGVGSAWAIWATSSGQAPSAVDDAPSADTDTALPEAVGDRVLDGPPVYIGEELDWFVLDDAVAASLVPSATSLTRTAELQLIGESEGIHTAPEQCLAWVMPDSYDVVGVRTARWDDGAFTVLQFPTDVVAGDYFQSIAGTPDCATFETRGADDTVYGTSAVEVLAETDRGFAGRVIESGGYGDGDRVRVLVLEGNVVSVLFTDTAALADPTGQSVIAAFEERSDAARSALTEKIGYR